MKKVCFSLIRLFFIIFIVFLMTGFASSMECNLSENDEMVDEENVKDNPVKQDIPFKWPVGFFHIVFDAGHGTVSSSFMTKCSKGLHFCPRFSLDFGRDSSSIKTATYGIKHRDYSSSLHRIVAYCAFYKVVDVKYEDHGWYQSISHIEVIGFAPLMKVTPF